MLAAAAVVASVVLAGLAVLQAAVAAGAPLGHLVWGGRHRVLPRGLRIGSVVSIGLYALFAYVLWDAALGSSEPDGGGKLGIWLLTGYFAVGIVPNALSRSLPERLVMTPVTAVLAGCALVLALES